MQRLSAVTIAIAMLTGGLAALAATAGASPAGPVTNSNFEAPPVPDSTGEALADTPADECYGIGHQAAYGSESPQGTASGGSFYPYAPTQADPVNPDEADPAGAVQMVADDPEGTADQQTGCFSGSQAGWDAAWIHPKARATQPAHWSMDIRNPSAEFGYNYDDDPFDREVKLLADDSLAHHNLWQWLGSKHQAFTPDADAFAMDVETGDVSGIVKLALTTNPLHEPGTNYYVDCMLTFTQSDLQNAMDEDGHIEADPVDATFNARSENCSDLQQQWNEGDEDAKRDVLSQTRITQLSFWDWERGTSEDSVIDNVEMPGANTAAEAAAGVDAPLN
jgi:hypothetical protein